MTLGETLSPHMVGTYNEKDNLEQFIELQHPPVSNLYGTEVMTPPSLSSVTTHWYTPASPSVKLVIVRELVTCPLAIELVLRVIRESV